MRKTIGAGLARVSLEQTINGALVMSELPENVDKVLYVRAITCPSCWRHSIAFGIYKATWDQPAPTPIGTHLVAKIMNGQIVPKGGH